MKKAKTAGDYFHDIAPETAKVKYDSSKAHATPGYASDIEKPGELFAYIENYPMSAAVLSIIYNPDTISYYFPKLSIDGESMEFAKKLVKNQIYASIVRHVKDASLLDRLESQINPSVTICFNVLPKADGA